MIEDSPHMCVRCGKRMHQEVDQDDVSNRPRVLHLCWSCGFGFEERRQVTGGTNPDAADRLARLRNA